MNRLMLICGNTGAGKSTFLRGVSGKYQNIGIIKKYSTRKARTDDNGAIEIEPDCSQDFIEPFEYKYVKFGNVYAFSKKDIDKTLNLGNGMLIIRDLAIFDQLIKDYGEGIVMPFFISRPIDIEKLGKVLKEQGRSHEEIQNRLQDLECDQTDIYNTRTRCFESRVITNLSGSLEEDMYKQFEALCNQFNVELKNRFVNARNE